MTVLAETIFAGNRAVGRVALAVACRDGVTRRARVREEGPLRVRCPGAPGKELEAITINSAGGIAGGDRFEIAVSVAENARLTMGTAAAEKIYRSLGIDATIAMKFELAEGASLAWLPQETILFDGAQLSRSIEIDMAPDARLIFAEAMVFGRSGMGEEVAQGRLFDRWRLCREGRLVHTEAMRLDGAIAARLAETAVAKGAVAFATVLVVPGDDGTATMVRALTGRFHGEVGASAWNGLAIVRLCAKDGAALRHDLIIILRAFCGPSLPRLWLN
jgi:urease accessory protein